MNRSKPPLGPPPADDRRSALDLSPAENADLCHGCVACCTYITVEVDSPRAAWEYDQWLWALHHERVNLYVEKPERWYLHFETRCRELDARGRCGIYDRRPVLCREYDPRSCERRYPLSDLESWFHSASEFEAWIRRRRPVHWERLVRYRDRKTEAAPGTTPGFIPILQLAGSLQASAAGRRRG